MDAFVIFAAMVLATVLDPIALVGFVVAGTLIRNYLAAMAAAIAWRIGAQLLIVVLLGDLGPQLPTAYSLLAMATGAVFITSIFFALASHSRSKRKQAEAQMEKVAASALAFELAETPKTRSFFPSSVSAVRSWPTFWRFLIAGSLGWAIAVLLYVWAFEPFDGYISSVEKWRVAKIILVAPLAILAAFGILLLFKREQTAK